MIDPAPPETFNAIFNYKAKKVPFVLFENVLLYDALVEQNRETACAIMSKAQAWLEEQNLSHELINLYDNTDHSTGNGQVLVKLRNKSTAIMLKLALN